MHIHYTLSRGYVYYTTGPADVFHDPERKRDLEVCICACTHVWEIGWEGERENMSAQGVGERLEKKIWFTTRAIAFDIHFWVAYNSILLWNLANPYDCTRGVYERHRRLFYTKDKRLPVSYYVFTIL